MKEVNHLLSKIASARKMIVHETNMIEKAEFRLTQTPDDEMWEKIKKEHEEKLCLASEQFDTLYQTFYSLKKYINKMNGMLL